MPRPRGAPDPDRFPLCARCGLAYPTVARWPDGGVCSSCYMAAKRTRGQCPRCGHDGVLPGRDDAGQPTCRTCSGITINVDCKGCGREDELYNARLCWSCVLAAEVPVLLAGPDGTVSAALQPLSDALAGMRRANSGITWLRNPAVRDLLTQLAAGALPLTHEALDTLPRSRTVEYIRGLLVEHDALPNRDRRVADFERWLAVRLRDIEDDEQRKVLERFGRWHQLRRLRDQARSAPVTHSAFLTAKQGTTVAGNYLRWLAEADLRLADVTQAHVDGWYAAGPSTRQQVETFLYWARSQRLVANIDIPRRSVPAGTSFGEAERLAAIRRILLDDEGPTLVNRVIAGLVLLLGQPVNRLVRLRTSNVELSDGVVALRVGRESVQLPEPFATLVAGHLHARPNRQTASNANSEWLFPGGMPGGHLDPGYVSNLLSAHNIPARSARAAAWRQAVREAPPSVLAEMLGGSAKTAMKHAELAGADYLRYTSRSVADDAESAANVRHP
jgi:integrase